MKYLVVKVMEIDADSAIEAAERADTVDWPSWVQPHNSVTLAACEAALVGAEEFHD